jgi:putative ABC transport system substrate-binding protein
MERRNSVMDRRTFIGAVARGVVAAPLAAYAQPVEKVHRIGLLRVGVGAAPLSKSFWETMGRLGWIEGQNVIVERRPASRADLLPGLAADLVKLKVDLIVANGTPATSAAKQATTTIPIVFRVADDPVGNGLVSSLARPGGNLTGVVDGIYEEKRLQILKEALPGIVRVAYPSFGGEDYGMPRAAKALGVQVLGIALKGVEEFDPFFVEARKGKADAALIPNQAGLGPHLERIGAEMLKQRLPGIGFDLEFVAGGGLLCYAPTPNYQGPILAAQIKKILSGTKPGDLPVEQPTKFDLVINLKTAKALSLTIPPSMLARASEVIR